MVGAWNGHCMASVYQTRPHCVNQMGKTHSKPLAARHGRGTAWPRHGNGMLCVNRPLMSQSEDRTKSARVFDEGVEIISQSDGGRTDIIYLKLEYWGG